MTLEYIVLNNEKPKRLIKGHLIKNHNQTLDSLKSNSIPQSNSLPQNCKTVTVTLQNL